MKQVASRSIFRAKIARYAAGRIQTDDIPLTRTPSTTAPLCDLCLETVLVPTYYTKPSANCLFKVLNEFK